MTERMRVAVPSLGRGGVEAERSVHFGRCDVFTLFDIVGGQATEVAVIDNPPHMEGGCLRPVQLLASHGVTALVAVGMGARPLAGFREAGIQVYFDDTTSKVGDVIELVVEGSAEPMDERSVCGGH